MKRLRLICAVMLSLGMGLPLFAQSDGNGAWQTLQNGAVSLRVPGDWTLIDGAGGVSGAVSLLNEVEVMFNIVLIPGGKPLADIISNPQGMFDTVVDTQPVNLPAGDGYRIESTQDKNTRQYHRLFYVLAVNNVMLTLSASVPVDSSDKTALLALIDRIANTLAVDDSNAAVWTRYQDISGKISLQAPSDWQQKRSSDKVLTLIQPELQAVVTLNYRTLSQDIFLENAAQMLLNAYQEQRVTVAGLDPAGLPVGEAYRALLMNVPAQTAGNSTIQTAGYQYIVLRGRTLLLINVGCEASQFEQHKALLEQMVDTIVFNP